MGHYPNPPPIFQLTSQLQIHQKFKSLDLNCFICCMYVIVCLQRACLQMWWKYHSHSKRSLQVYNKCASNFLLTTLRLGGKKPAYGTQGSTVMVTRWRWVPAVVANIRTVQVITRFKEHGIDN